MAIVTSLTTLQGERFKRHRTEVVAHYKVFGEGANGPLLQINTYGSDERATGGVSQTLQFDRASAEQLWRLLGDTYRFR